MLVVMKAYATGEQVRAVCEVIAAAQVDEAKRFEVRDLGAPHRRTLGRTRSLEKAIRKSRCPPDAACLSRRKHGAAHLHGLQNNPDPGREQKYDQQRPGREYLECL